MGKVVTLGKVKEIKPIPRCPLSMFLGSPYSSCQHMGLSFSPAHSEPALVIGTALSKQYKTLKHPPKEYIIVDTVTLLACIPLYTSKLVRCTASTLHTAMCMVEERMIDTDISCYNLTVYYNHMSPDIFLHPEDLHPDNEW